MKRPGGTMNYHSMRREKKHRWKFNSILLILVIIVSLNQTGFSQGTIKGLMFSDYFYAVNHHDKTIQGNHGFWFRRIYLTYNNDLSEKIKMRLRLEMKSAGDFISKSKLTPIVKDAYLSYSMRRHNFKFGIIPTPTEMNIVDYWGYRAVEKTPFDLHKFSPTRDFGFSLSGTLDQKEKISYLIMYGNGASVGSETNRGKKLYGQIGFKPNPNLYIEAYGDYEKQDNNKTYHLYQIFMGYKSSWGRVAIQFARRFLKQGPISEDWPLLSIFGVIKVLESVEFLTRYDRMFSPNPSGAKISYIPFSNDSSSHFVIGGLSWEAEKNIWFIPNVKYVFYEQPESGVKPSDDLYLNITVFFKF